MTIRTFLGDRSVNRTVLNLGKKNIIIDKKDNIILNKKIIGKYVGERNKNITLKIRL